MNDFSKAFLGIVLASLPFLLLGTVLGGIVEAFIPAARLKRMFGESSVRSVFLAGLLGLVLPMCECGMVVVLRRLMAKGFPIGVAITYMLASPIVSVVVAVGTYVAFTEQEPLLMTTIRLGAGYVIAVTVGLLAMRFSRENVLKEGFFIPVSAGIFQGGIRRSAGEQPQGGFGVKCRQAMHCAAGDFLEISAYLVLGASVASVFNTVIDQSALAAVGTSRFWSVQAMIGLAAALCLCSSSDAFVAASLTSFSLASRLSMLVFGPMVDVKLLFLYASAFRWRFILIMVTVIYVMSAGLGIALGGWMP